MFVKRIYLENFLSFAEEEYEFDRGKPLLIQGKNFSKKGQESNGSGKSALQAALEYSIMKTTSRKTRDVELIRRGCDKAKIECTIVDPVNNEEMIIQRIIPKSGSSSCGITINDVPVKNLTNVIDADKFIINWLGITKEDLQNYYILNKERYLSFFYSSNTKKLELISRMYDFSFINNSIQDLKGKVDNEEIKKREVELEMEKLEGKIESLNEALSNINNGEFEENKKARIEKCNEDIKKALLLIDKDKADIIDLDIYKTEKKEEIEKLQEEHKKIDPEKFKGDTSEIIEKAKKLDGEIKGLKESIEKMNPTKEVFVQELKKLNQEFTDIEKTLMGVIECPKCKNQFLLKKEGVNISDLKERKKELIKEVKETEKDIDETDELILELKGKKREKEKSLSDCVEEKRKIEKKYDDAVRKKRDVSHKMEEIDLEINRTETKIKAIEENSENTKEGIKQIREKINLIENEENDNSHAESLKKQIKEIKVKQDDEVNKFHEVNNEITRLNVWSFYFQKFKMSLSNKILDIIQTKINGCLVDMNSDIRLKLEGFKQKADGTLKEEITPMIIDNGDIVSFNSLSGGERARVEYSCVVAIQDLINSTHEKGGLDIIWTDEIAEGLDALGVRNVLVSLEAFNKTILVTTHTAIDELYDNTLLVKNENYISKIVK
jgi:exonuclease SbcC